MKSIVIPIDFLKSLGDKKPIIRILWIKWLSDYSDHLFENDFINTFYNSHLDKKLNLELLHEAYNYGIVYFKNGVIYQQEKKSDKNLAENLIMAKEIIDYLNINAQSSFTLNTSNKKLILNIINEGYQICDFLKVIDKKIAQWKGTSLQIYLRPITLFQLKKFENYLHESEFKQPERKSSSNISKLSGAAIKAKKIFS